MKQMRFNRFVAALLIGVLLIGAIPGAMPARAAGEFSVAFAEPYAAVGKPMTLDVQGASGNINYSWTVDDVFVSAEASYAPTANDLMKWITVTVTSGSDEAELEMFFSKLPVVYINTEGGQAITSKEKYIDAELVIQGNETYNSETTKLYDGATEIRGRGNSTWNQPKKPYRLKLDKKTDLFGMGKSKHWVLLANYLDESLQRNTLAYNLSGAMDMEQMSTVFVDVILNGDFVGNYQLCENIRIDDTRVDIFDWEGLAEDAAGIIAEAENMDEDTTGDLEEYMAETDMGWITSGSFTFNGTRYSIADYSDIEIPDINGGYLLELDEYYDEVSKFRTDNNQPIMFKNPEFVNTNKDMIGFVQDYVQAFEDAVQAESYTVEYDGKTVHYSDLYDFDALVDYWLINEIFFNEELNKKSTYMYKDIDGLMFMGPIWDMDWSSGGEGQTYHTEQWATQYYNTNAQSKQWYKYLIEDPYFFTKAQERYWEIRNNQVAAMLKELDDNYELLKESAAANGERWGYKHDYDYYVDGLRDWFAKHLVWLDEQMATQGSLRNSLDYKADGLTLSLTDDQGKALAADTTAVAPADAVAELGASVKLNIQGGKNTSGTAVLYVNGRRVSETAVKADSTTVVQVPDSALTASAGEKNVLEVKIDNGSYEESAGYITLILRDPNAACEHKYITVLPAVDATCTETGLTQGEQCSSCNTILTPQVKTPSLGHTEVANPGQAPTFDAPGMTGGTYCDVCGDPLSDAEEIPMLDYNEGIVPLEALTVICGDYEPNTNDPNEGPADLVMDDDFKTIWHTSWKGTSREDHWIQFEISGDYSVEGLRYKPRTSGATNGIITEYEILVSNDGVEFTSVASGKWTNDRTWKVAEFDAQTVKYVRLQSHDAEGNGINVFASAAEIRLVQEKIVEKYTVTVAVDGEGGTVTGGAEDVEEGTSHTVTAAAAEGYAFAGWFVDGKKVSEKAEYTFTVTEDVDLVAKFVADEPDETDPKETYPDEEDPDETEPDASEPDASEPDASEPDASEPDASEPDASEPVASEPDASEPDASEPEYTVPECDKDDNCTLSQFEDIKIDDWYHDGIHFCVEQGIMNGMGEGKFAPNEATTRAQLVTMLYRLAGEPSVEGLEEPFTDVTADDWFYAPIVWAYENKVVNGVSDTEFAPNANVTREQVATILHRYLGAPAGTGKLEEFPDVAKVSEYAVAPLTWAVGEGLITGVAQPDGTTVLDPAGNATRAQIATILMRYLTA